MVAVIINLHLSSCSLVICIYYVFRSTFGIGMCVPRRNIAFSDPTSHGKMFAAKYTGSENFLVYKP